MPICPKCGSSNPRENTTCRKCGAVLGLEVSPTDSQPEVSAAEESPPTESTPSTGGATLAELNLSRLILFAGVAVLVLGVIWYLAEHFSGRPLAYIGLPAGWIIGQALYFGARGKRGRILQWLALGLTVALFIVVEMLVVATTPVPNVEDGNLFQKLLAWIQLDTLGLFFLLIGLWQAYSIPAPRRPARQEEESAAETETSTEGETRSAETEGGEPATEESPAEEPAPQDTYLTCVRCKASVAESEAWVIPGRGRSGPVVICPECGNELETQFEAETRDLNMGRASLYGVGAAIVAGIVWYIAEYFAKMSLGFIAWAGAWGIGEAVRRGAGRKRGRPLQLLSVGLTLLLILGTQFALLAPTQPFNDAYPRYSRDGAFLSFESDREGNTEIYAVRTASGEPVRLTDNPAYDGQAAWAGDSRHLVFVSERDGNAEIYSTTVPTPTLARLTATPSQDTHPAWSPDGRWIAFQTDRDGNDEVYVMAVDGSGPVNLTQHPAADGYPTWSPDGTRIAFQSDRDGQTEIYVMAISGTAVISTTRLHAVGTSPAWSFDGLSLAFVSARDGNDEVYVMSADGSAQTRLTDNAAHDTQPSWAPESSAIIFVSERDGNPEIYGVTLDGETYQRLTNDPQGFFQAFVTRRLQDLFTPLLYLLALWQAWNSGAPRRLIGVQKPQPQD